MTLVEHQPTKLRPKPAKRLRISSKVREACDLLADKQTKTIKAAAEAVGLTREHLSRELSKPHVQEFLTRESRRTIAMAAMRASHRVVELIDATSEHVSLDASKHVLAIEGIKPAEERGALVNIAISPGYVIDLSDPRLGVIEGTVSTDSVPPQSDDDGH